MFFKKERNKVSSKTDWNPSWAFRHESCVCIFNTSNDQLTTQHLSPLLLIIISQTRTHPPAPTHHRSSPSLTLNRALHLHKHNVQKHSSHLFSGHTEINEWIQWSCAGNGSSYNRKLRNGKSTTHSHGRWNHSCGEPSILKSIKLNVKKNNNSYMLWVLS